MAAIGDVGRVHHDLTTVGDDRLHLVEALGPRPEVGIAIGDDREHPLHRVVEVADVRLGCHLRRGSPSAGRVPERQRLQPPACVVYHDAERVALARDEVRGRIDERVDRCDAAPADDGAARDQRAEPVRDVDHLLTGQTGEEILVPSREPDHLVRQHGAHEQRHVALDSEPVHPYVDRVMEPAFRELGDEACR